MGFNRYEVCCFLPTALAAKVKQSVSSVRLFPPFIELTELNWRIICMCMGHDLIDLARPRLTLRNIYSI